MESLWGQGVMYRWRLRRGKAAFWRYCSKFSKIFLGSKVVCLLLLICLSSLLRSLILLVFCCELVLLSPFNQPESIHLDTWIEMYKILTSSQTLCQLNELALIAMLTKSMTDINLWCSVSFLVSSLHALEPLYLWSTWYVMMNIYMGRFPQDGIFACFVSL